MKIGNIRVQSLIIIFVLLIVAFYARIADAEIQGTALSNDRDILRIDLNGGPASPAPGVQSGASVLWTLQPSQAVGVASSFSVHNLEEDDAIMYSIANDLVWEHSVALLEGYHALRVRGGFGASRIHRKIDETVARERGKQADRKKWAPHASVSLALDFPVADLMWGRVGVWSGRSFIKESPMEGGIFLAWVFGGQWLSVGD